VAVAVAVAAPGEQIVIVMKKKINEEEAWGL
jgi:hypothetical protein